MARRFLNELKPLSGQQGALFKKQTICSVRPQLRQLGGPLGPVLRLVHSCCKVPLLSLFVRPPAVARRPLSAPVSSIHLGCGALLPRLRGPSRPRAVKPSASLASPVVSARPRLTAVSPGIQDAYGEVPSSRGRHGLLLRCLCCEAFHLWARRSHRAPPL